MKREVAEKPPTLPAQADVGTAGCQTAGKAETTPTVKINPGDLKDYLMEWRFELLLKRILDVETPTTNVDD
jgi:hypothetical protein